MNRPNQNDFWRAAAMDVERSGGSGAENSPDGSRQGKCEANFTGFLPALILTFG
jgi:hypothetical protein